MSAVALQSFIYEADAVRVVMVEDKPWWVAADIAARLGYSHVPSMVRLLKGHQKGVHKVHTPGGEQGLTIISEGGLFKCIMRSKRPEAEKFGDWVTDELLPTLRLTGRYEIANDEVVADVPQMPDEVDALRTKLAIAREARIVFGLKMARKAWRLVGLLPELTDGMAEERSPSLLPSAVARICRSVLEWLEARTEAVPGHRVMSQALYDDYLNWTKAEGVDRSEVVTMTSFGRALTNCGVVSTKSEGGRIARVGLKLIA